MLYGMVLASIIRKYMGVCMKTIFSIFFFSVLFTSGAFASTGESETECAQMQEATERVNPKANLDQTKQNKKPSSSSAVRG